MIKTVCLVVAVVTFVVYVAYKIYTDVEKTKAKAKLISEISDETETMVESLEQMCEDIEKICNDYEYYCYFEMNPKNQDKSEE